MENDRIQEIILDQIKDMREDFKEDFNILREDVKEVKRDLNGFKVKFSTAYGLAAAAITSYFKLGGGK